MTTLRIITAALLALIFAPTTLAQTNPEVEVGETLDAWHKAAAESRFGDYFALLTKDAIFVGTDATEHWNVDQFKDYAREPFAQGNGWDMQPADRRTRMSADNQTAWVVERLHHARMGELRGSGVLVATPEGYRISQYVLSLPVPNDVTLQVLNIISVYEKTGALLGDWRCALACDGGDIEFGISISAEGDQLTAQIRTPDTAEDIYEEITAASFTDGQLTLSIEHYDSVIRATLDPDSGQLLGTWTKTRGPSNTATLPFRAHKGRTAFEDARYKHARAEKRQLTRADFTSSSYKATFSSSEDPAILDIATCAGAASATFRTTTGDYRYLNGMFTDGQLTLSTFDGAHAFLFKATQQPDGSLVGDFWSGNWWHESWTATPDDSATLRDPWRMTTWNPSTNLADLAYPNLDGHARALDAPEFAGKCKIIEIFGTWCPNCMDATKELKRLRNKYGTQGLSVLALAFEVTGDTKRDTAQVQRYIELTNINYPVLLAGTSKKSESSKAFPALDRIRSYPTFIFLDAHDRVRGIYTGFSGPATGEHFKKQQADFEALIEKILAES